MAEHTTVCMKKYILVCCFFVETTCPTNSVTLSCTHNILPWQTLALDKEYSHVNQYAGILDSSIAVKIKGLGDFSNTRNNHPKNPTKMHPSSWTGKDYDQKSCKIISCLMSRLHHCRLFAGIFFYKRFAQTRCCCTTHWRWGGVWT